MKYSGEDRRGDDHDAEYFGLLFEAEGGGQNLF
jgi:hypothetical protein